MGDISMSETYDAYNTGDESYVSKLAEAASGIAKNNYRDKEKELAKWFQDAESKYQELLKKGAELKKKEEELATREEQIKNKPTLLTDEKVPFNLIPIFYCPECKCQMETNMMADQMRIRVIHHGMPNCSRDNTYIIRPLAQFTQFI